MPLIERIRSVSACIQIDAKPEFELFDSFSSSLKTNSLLKFYQNQQNENPQLEYFGKVPLPRNCAHEREMEQLKLHAETITVENMNNLIDLGWRREGTNFYKVSTQCCATHALRLDCQEFRLNKNQRKILNHLADYVKGSSGEKTLNKKPKNNKTSQEEYSLEAYMKRLFDNCVEGEHDLEVRIVRPGSSLFNETYEESYLLFKKYQEHIHKNKYTREIFENMLVATPLPTSGTYGTFHRQYLLDGRLVGVDMFDLLPGYNMAQVSYYDIDLMNLNLGTFMILNEILFTQRMSEKLGKHIWLSTGLYNHCFKKHHYKLGFATEILCIETYTWIPLDKNIVQKLEEEKSIMCHDSSALEKPEVFTVPCLYKGKIYKFGRIYQKLVVKTTRKRMCSLVEFNDF